jgi:hypothetical protein
MIVFNTKTNTYEAGFVPGSVSEIVCDNFEFAQNAYPVTAINNNIKDTFRVFPNPASKKINIMADGFDNNGIINIYSLNGDLCLSKQINSLQEEINIESLKSGIYVLSIQNAAGIKTQKLIIQ